MIKENKFQSKLIKNIKERLPEAMVFKNDPKYIQGVPDLLILHGDRWAALECKRSANASHRPNQDYYVDKMNEMSYAAFVCPENEKDILDGLEQALGVGR